MSAPTDRGPTCEVCLGPGASSTAEDAETGDRYDVHERCGAKMSTPTETPAPSFVISHEAWYWPACKMNRTASIVIGLTYEGACCDYEFSIEWGPCTHGTLRIHDDGFQAITSPEFAGFFARLAEWGRSHGNMFTGRDIRPESVVSMLLACGFPDKTERTRKTTEPEAGPS